MLDCAVTPEMTFFNGLMSQMTNDGPYMGIVICQCTDSLQTQVRAEDEYEAKSANYDSIWFIKSLKKVISGVTAQSNIYHSLFHALKDFHKIRQQC